MDNTTPPAAGASQNQEPTWAVILVHGVGDTAPGATLGAFLPSLQAKRQGLKEIARPQNRLLPEPPPQLPPVVPAPLPPTVTESSIPIADRFPMHLRKFRVLNPSQGHPRQGVFAEVFWADLSAAGESRWDVLKRLVKLIFDLRHIANVAAAYPNSASGSVLRWLLYLVSGLLCGPIAGLTVFILYLLVGRYAAVMLFELVGLGVPAYVQEAGLGLLALIAVAVAPLWMMRRTGERDETWSLFGWWFFLGGVISVVVAFCRLILTPSWPWETNLAGILTSRLLVDPKGLRAEALSSHLAIHLWAIYAVFVVLAVFTVVAFFAWGFARGRAWLRREKAAGPALNAALGANLLQVMLWVIIGTALGLLVLSRFPPELTSTLFRTMLTGLTMKGGVAATIALCATAVWLWRKIMVLIACRQIRTLTRLLVNPVIMYPLIGLTLLSLVTFAHAFSTGNMQLHDVLKEYTPFVRQVTILVAIALISLFWKGVRNWLHIMTDVTSHFYRPQLNPGQLNIPAGAFPIQQRIEARFRRVLQEVLQLGDVTHVTVIAHSQGTVTAIDVLWLEWAANVLAGKTVYLVTMGSPFTHLYQYYFPHRYPPLFIGGKLNPLWGSQLNQTITKWTNIYRIDDFIGTFVDRDAPSQFLSNEPLKKSGGHTGYWRDSEALDLMLPYLPG